jgi:hypothetical protein
VRRRSLAAVLILVLALLTRLAWGDGDDGFGGVPWPRHIEWTVYTVPAEGWMLCRPSTPADSTAAPMTCLSLTEGTEVYVPRWVPGPDPNLRKKGMD